jgi:NAD(P)-dependent dehydrogenase (short-subunit alcohol dehydrogenase family)
MVHKRPSTCQPFGERTLTTLLGAAGEQGLKMMCDSVSLGMLGTPNEIAKAVVFVASNESSYITETELFVRN